MTGLIPGTVIGRYTVVAPIGRGGQGGVWEVTDASGQRYALKSPAGDLESGSVSNQRFAREVNALRLLDHPNLVSAHDAFVDKGTLYLVMERVAGQPLTDPIAAGPLAPRRALVIARQVLAGLGHAHDQGITHRDLKPDNILLVQAKAKDGGTWEQAKLVDFGLAKLVGELAGLFGASKLTRTGTVTGTPLYMPPEAALGKEVDARADLYQLGVILFEMLAGRPPFADPDPVMVMRMHCKAPLPRLDEVVGGAPWCTPQVMVLVEGALSKDPDSRFPSAEAMTAVLDDAFRSLDGVG
jgi:serine/threonine-protein kinase